MAKTYTVMAWILAKACTEEPDALIALVRVCGGALGEPGALPGNEKDRTESHARSQGWLKTRSREDQLLTTALPWSS
jgi:hypothetical protein